MTAREIDNPYDAFYFAHSCGRPYQRDDVWLQFFATIADRIVSDFRPRTVLDAGCAMGFLVEALRERGVDAFGVDVSEYAIQQVRPEVRAFCRVGSIVDPLSQKYDLIVCIEVLEHLSTSQAEQAIDNFCQHADEVLFSSTPFDYKEATHVNVQPPDYWTELFARHGFFRDVEFDASFISAWAARFRRSRDPVARAVAVYERRMWRLEQDNRARRELTLEQRNELARKEQQIQMLQAEGARKEQQVQALQAEVTGKEQQVRALQKEIAGKTDQSRALQTEIEERERRLRLQMEEVEKLRQDLRVERAGREKGLLTEVAEKQRALQGLRLTMAEKERHAQALSVQVENLRQRLSLIEVDYGWRFLQKVKRVRLRFAPHGSRRERWFLGGLSRVFPGPSDTSNVALLSQDDRSAPLSHSETLEEKPSAQATVATGSTARTIPIAAKVDGWGKRLLLVSGSTGDMERYRCLHLREQLRLLGVHCELRRITDPQLTALVSQYKLVVLHRVAHDQRVENLISTARVTFQATVIFDVDDLVFQPELAVWMRVLQTMSSDGQALFRDGLQRYRRTLELCDGVLAATEVIAEAARSLGKPAWVHRNALSLELLALSEQAYAQRVPTEGKVILGYASGTRTHEQDFAEVESALERILQTYPNTELHILGHLDLDPRWDRWTGRIKRVPFMPWQDLPRALASLDINLAPLEMNNPFCAGKSELKYFEAAAVGVPTIASRWGSFLTAIRSGDNGFLAATPDDWYGALERLLADPTLRRAMGERARTDVLLRYSPMKKGQELLTTLDNLWKNQGGWGEPVLSTTQSNTTMIPSMEQNGTGLPSSIPGVVDAQSPQVPIPVDIQPQGNKYNVTHPQLEGPLRFPEHGLAHQLLDGLKGLEIGAASYNPFGLDTRNVAPQEDYEFYAAESRKLGVEPAPIDIVAFGDNLPLPDESEDFVLSSHVVEHLPNVIKGLLEWNRVVRNGGYVFMIVPLKGALPDDEPRELTPVDHFITDYGSGMTIDSHPVEGVPGGRMGHYHTFSPDSLLEVVEWMKQNKLCDWQLVAREDVDTKVGNGFTLAFRVHH
jgi:2-polyprenyl-3-methyl-5-hydroxy-6-metoxy-1,4-benzoquinol methylase/glycosyltransferase involved in cell wall biosynthesis